jgi:ribosomal protein S18 acetylase RimI-like enzyme
MHVKTHLGHLVQAMPGGRVLSEGDLFVADSGLSCDTLNVVACARLDSQEADARIKSVVHSFQGRRFSWWLGPEDTPNDLPLRLQAAGLNHVESDLRMQLDLHRWAPATASPCSLCIRSATTAIRMDQFAAVVAANWSPPDQHLMRFYRQTAHVALRPDSPLRFFVGYLEGEAVTTCELAIGADRVAGIYSVATRKAFRRRGFGSAITQHALTVAHDLGMRQAVLQSSSEGAGIYKRLGFREFGEFREFKPTS